MYLNLKEIHLGICKVVSRDLIFSVIPLAVMFVGLLMTYRLRWRDFRLVGKAFLPQNAKEFPRISVLIPFGRGVCGSAWQRRETLVVPDVEQFPGHIACSSLSRSEIVVPVFSQTGEVVAVLDIDSKELATFDETDRQYLEAICGLITM